MHEAAKADSHSRVREIIDAAKSLPIDNQAQVVSALLGVEREKSYQVDIAQPEEIESLADAIARRIEQ